MDGDFDQAAALRNVYLSAPGKAWRLYRLTLVDTHSGDAAQEACTTPPGNQQSRRSVARHEIGHALAKYLVRGRSGSVAMTSWGGCSGGFDSQADAEVKGFGKTDAEYREPFETALSLAGVADRAARVRAALVRLFGKLWYRASICELGHELFTRGFIDETELEAYFEVMFPRSPAHIRALAADAELAAAPGAPGEGGGGAGATTGDVCPDRAGGNGPAAGAEGARPVRIGADDEAGKGLSGAVDSHPVWQNLTPN